MCNAMILEMYTVYFFSDLTNVYYPLHLHDEHYICEHVRNKRYRMSCHNIFGGQTVVMVLFNVVIINELMTDTNIMLNVAL